MAITFGGDEKGEIELRDFLELVDKSNDVMSRDVLISHAGHLRMLSNNRQFLANVIIGELKNIYDFQPKNNYTAQTIMLGGVAGKFYVRANVWLPARLLHPVNYESEKRLYSFERGHDHNFEFITAGYLGNGYETHIYDYDGNCEGYVGEKVELKLLERTVLHQHKVMLYRASRDVHIQKMPADDFSISLNLLAPPIPGSKQYIFDLESQRIASILRANYIGQSWLIEAAGYLCNDDISDVLASIAGRHCSAETRRAAQRALAVRYPDLFPER
ncbi:hypothetical protein [Bradyrhizobium liaoningense]|uniref:hypothetical protein n=1 Tax=Bradyrhizobium liaoningense TaxID=43992 RepID=UPI001BA4D3BF|nr:hypothetical protein [Bradyrhizobium liaoningense]MBR0820278.1 hypothetical protein [Bradyrhizobium liaoningense]